MVHSLNSTYIPRRGRCCSVLFLLFCSSAAHHVLLVSCIDRYHRSVSRTPTGRPCSERFLLFISMRARRWLAEHPNARRGFEIQNPTPDLSTCRRISVENLSLLLCLVLNLRTIQRHARPQITRASCGRRAECKPNSIRG